MSSIIVAGDTSGTITLSAPAVSGSSVLTLPVATDTLVGKATTDTLTNKTLTSPTLTTPNINSAQFATVSGTGPLYACRAWVNFDGGGTVAIRASGNVSSVSDDGVGTYGISFTTAFSDANYAMAGSVQDVNNTGDAVLSRAGGGSKTTTYADCITVDFTGTRIDCPSIEILYLR